MALTTKYYNYTNTISSSYAVSSAVAGSGSAFFSLSSILPSFGSTSVITYTAPSNAVGKFIIGEAGINLLTQATNTTKVSLTLTPSWTTSASYVTTSDVKLYGDYSYLPTLIAYINNNKTGVSQYSSIYSYRNYSSASKDLSWYTATQTFGSSAYRFTDSRFYDPGIGLSKLPYSAASGLFSGQGKWASGIYLGDYADKSFIVPPGNTLSLYINGGTLSVNGTAVAYFTNSSRSAIFSNLFEISHTVSFNAIVIEESSTIS